MRLTKRQQQILDFIGSQKETGGQTPSLREIAQHFHFKSVTGAVGHIEALVRKGFLTKRSGTARSWQIVSSLDDLRQRVIDVPVYGSIPAGHAQEEKQQAAGCISIDVETLGIRSSARTFALQVRGDSMIGKNILDGDFVVFEHGVEPKVGDVVAALIDNESTLKTFFRTRGKAYLKAENPNYPQLVPAAELVIQGVMRALVRHCR